MDASSIRSRDRTSQNVIEGLKELYSQLLKPIEDIYNFDKFNYDTITDSELEAKPSVLVLGQYSTGKTSLIKYLIGRDYPSIHIGPEPTTDRFMAILHGDEDRIVKGNSLTVVKELPFAGLNKFGGSFLNKFEAAITPSEMLRSLTFVDTPGVLSGEKQRTSRMYDFPKVCKWFADRADLVLLLFDAHKLDISDEFKEVIEGLRDQDDKVRCILNKADQIDREKLMRVYGALMWSMGKIFRSAEVVRVYVGSFWDEADRDPEASAYKDNLQLFQRDEKELLREISELPGNSAVRKVNEIVKRVRLVKVHVCLLSHLRAQMPPVFGQGFAQARLMDHLPEVFEEVKKRFHLSDGDMPNIEEFHNALQNFNFREFPRLNRKILQHLDDILNKDIPAVLSKVGGVDNVMKFSKIQVEETDADRELQESLRKARMEALKSGTFGISRTIKRMRSLGSSAKDRVAEKKAKAPPAPKTWFQEHIYLSAALAVILGILILLLLVKFSICSGLAPHSFVDWLSGEDHADSTSFKSVINDDRVLNVELQKSLDDLSNQVNLYQNIVEEQSYTEGAGQVVQEL
mmetsp:Transcript_12724/g.16721  ORF Transcript_12724/g.16721 Transcript_12724/m.16721 type:complete len:573 (+) Transcript_12724:285-2003(+)